jgi:8-amino-3,8-dideoxy-alpha-D-manno-octulosonate transaminase
VICPALGFAATSMAVVMAGGVPVFCDVDESLQIDPAGIGPLVTPRTVAVAPTHHWSNVVDMKSVLDIAHRRGLKVVEDCAQSPGAKYRGRYVGTLGHVGCFSISAYKIVGGGEGGMVVTDDPRLFDRVCQLAEGGGLWRTPRFGPPRYKGELFAGTNYRMSELEAAVDVVQLGKLDQVVRRCRRVSRRVRRQLGRYRQIAPQKINDSAGAIGYALRFFPETCELGRRIADALRAEGIGAATRGRRHAPDWHMARYMFPVVLKTGHIPGGSVFEDPRYLARGGHAEYRPGQCPVAEDLFAREVSVGLDQWWSDADCDAVAAGINKVLSAYCTKLPGNGAWG